MKRTAKYKAAIRIAATTVFVAQSMTHLDNAALYDALEKKGWFWNADAGVWKNIKRSTSMFESDEKLPTGIFRLRLMCHPGDLDRCVEILREALDTYGVTIDEISNPYPNRKGPGMRVYLSAKLPEKKGRKKS